MDRLWAPWRLEYIKSANLPSSDCFLCDAAASGINRERLVLYHQSPVISVMNLFPYNNGHILIAPERHVGEIKDLTPEECAAIFLTVQKATGWLEKAYGPHGFNVGMNLGRVAGAGLPGHLHVHIVPRWNGDINFMPVTGATKVMSEALEAGWEKLRAVIKEETDLIGFDEILIG